MGLKKRFKKSLKTDNMPIIGTINKHIFCRKSSPYFQKPCCVFVIRRKLHTWFWNCVLYEFIH